MTGSTATRTSASDEGLAPGDEGPAPVLADGAAVGGAGVGMGPHPATATSNATTAVRRRREQWVADRMGTA